MMQFNRWDVWFASVRFEDSTEVKSRPVVITDHGEVYVLALKVTSHAPRDVWGEYALVYWREAGLSKPSTVRISKRLRLEPHDMIRKVGTLHPADIMSIITIMRERQRNI